MMMSPGLGAPRDRDPFSIPKHVADAIKKSPPPGFWGNTKGRGLELQVCGMCGIPDVVSMRNLDDKDAPNEIVSMCWMTEPSRCRFCGPIYSRYPEVALWVANVMAWREFVGSDPTP